MKQKTQWKRKCPKCNKELYYSSNKTLVFSINKNGMCSSCCKKYGLGGMKGKHHSTETKNLMSKLKKESYLGQNNPFYGKTHSNETKNLLSSYAKLRTKENNGMYGKHHTDETKLKMKNIRLGKTFEEIFGSNASEIKKKLCLVRKNKTYEEIYGKEKAKSIIEKKSIPRGKNKNPCSPETRLRKRLSALKRIKNSKGQVIPNYNSKSIPFLEQKAKELGIADLQHAENGGEFFIKELGYWVDGYSKEKNIVIEYYEKHHKKQKEKDERRKQEIINHLNCNFIELE